MLQIRANQRKVEKYRKRSPVADDLPAFRHPGDFRFRIPAGSTVQLNCSTCTLESPIRPHVNHWGNPLDLFARLFASSTARGYVTLKGS